MDSSAQNTTMATQIPPQQSTWTSVDTYATQALLSNHSYASALDSTTSIARQANLPSIEVSPLQGAFLSTQCQLANAKHVLEIGTLGGCSAIWMASSGPDVHVTTIEVEPSHAEVARQAVRAAGLEGRVEVLLGAGKDVLPLLRAEVEEGKRSRFDFVFIDADKENNLLYLREAVAMCRPRAAVVVDNVVRRGALASEEAAKKDVRVEGSRQVVEAVGRGEIFMGCSLLQTVGVKGYDGFLIGVVADETK